MNSFEKKKELTFLFHLYSDDLQYNIPGVIEYGEDVEFNSQCRMPAIQAAQDIMYRTALNILHINKEDSINSILLTRIAYEDKDEKFQYVLNFLTDISPRPQRNMEVSAKRKELVDNGELGQSWWIDCIDMPDGSVITEDKLGSNEIELFRKIVQKDIDSFLVSIQTE